MAKSILGISFDGIPVSGIVNEFLNIAWIFHRHSYRVLFDFGYEILLNPVPGTAVQPLPGWVEPVNALGKLPLCYDCRRIREAKEAAIAGIPLTASRQLTALASSLAENLLHTFQEQEVDYLVVENGTLPENPIVTSALLQAVHTYGRMRNLGKFVLWRDHDLMWSIQPQHWGEYPYPGIEKPQASPYIHFAVATEWMRQRMRAWVSPDTEFHIIPNRFFARDPASRTKSIRNFYRIPRSSHLVARCTRIIPQKCIERDLLLFNELQQRLDALGNANRLYLFVTGPTQEDPEEFDRLVRIERELTIAGQVIWGNGLLPFASFPNGAASEEFSIADLLAEADLSSFLTSYDYEGFGNPPGEAMAAGVPFLSTTYELYYEVYGQRGALAPLLPIDRTSSASDPIPDHFKTLALRCLLDTGYREALSRHNLLICQRYFSLDVLEDQVEEMFFVNVGSRGQT